MNLLEMIKRSGNVADRNILAAILDGDLERLGTPEYKKYLMDALSGTRYNQESKWPLFSMYRFNSPGMRQIPFNGDIIIATDKKEADSKFRSSNPTINHNYFYDENFEEIPGPLPREYYPSHTFDELAEAAYPYLAEDWKSYAKKRKQEAGRLKSEMKNCKPEDWIEHDGNNVRCRDLPKIISDINKYLKEWGPRIESLPKSLDEVELDPLNYSDSYWPIVRNKANKLISGED